MARIDKNGIIHGSKANDVYREYQGKQVIQSKPKEFKQTPNSQEGNLEFSLSSTTAMAIRHAFGYTYAGYDGKMVNRLNSAVYSCILASSKERGERDLNDADLSYLEGFQFNNNSPTDKVFKKKPKAYLDAENKILIDIPSLSYYDIKSSHTGDYLLRFVVIAFHFKNKAFHYNGLKEITIRRGETLEGGEIRLEDELLKGRVIMLSMSLHGYHNDHFGGVQTINSSSWSPSEILAAWHIPAGGPEDETVAINNKPLGLTYNGNEYLDKIAQLRNKVKTKKKTRGLKAKRKL
ncbi:hypothetical protein [Desertivirga xinjiangensis]|uniref:hypothetical protein n=1 Tax=Desertivirga xinjiangensis TaxID=539206 RepID=UPI002109D87D|nr:hypothetical protein [Pedobacter xinjiangensis]